VTAHLQDLQRSYCVIPRRRTLCGQAVTFFARWLESEGRMATLDELNRAAIREWLAMLNEDHEPAPSRSGTAACTGSASGLSMRTSSPATPGQDVSTDVDHEAMPIISDDDLVACSKPA
jgi:hypothetical protein